MAGTGNRQTLSADGATTAKTFVGRVRLSLTGTFGGGTAKLQAEDPGGAFVDVANGSFTAVTDTLFDFPEPSSNKLKIDLSGSTTPALVIWIQGKQLGLN